MEQLYCYYIKIVSKSTYLDRSCLYLRYGLLVRTLEAPQIVPPTTEHLDQAQTPTKSLSLMGEKNKNKRKEKKEREKGEKKENEKEDYRRLRFRGVSLPARILLQRCHQSGSARSMIQKAETSPRPRSRVRSESFPSDWQLQSRCIANLINSRTGIRDRVEAQLKEKINLISFAASSFSLFHCQVLRISVTW